MERVLLAVYGIKILKKRVREEQVLSLFGNNTDFLKLFYDFAFYVFKSKQELPRSKDGTRTLVLTCVEPPVINEVDRIVYGFFDAGLNGERYRVRDYTGKQPKVTDVGAHQHSMRDPFFYLYVPKGRKRAYLVLQRSEGQGIKDLVLNLLQRYMYKESFMDFLIEDTNLINDKVFNEMLDKGFFKKLSLIKYGVPKNIEAFNNDNVKPTIAKGSIKTTYQAADLTGFRELGRRLFNLKPKDDERIVVEISGERQEVDEVSMCLDLGGKQKTFHVANSSRVQPDVDVTGKIKYNAAKHQLDVNDLIAEARSLVEDVTDKPKDDAVEN